MTLFPRSSGVLLHPTSLPGRYGIGDLGEYAYRFADYLESIGQTIWQVLPLGPTSYGDSPYQCLSAFAGNSILISLDKLVGDGWLKQEELDDVPDFPEHLVDFGPVIDYHNRKLELAYQRFEVETSDGDEQRRAFNTWAGKNAYWLDDWALFIALKDENGGKPWVEWAEDEALGKVEALEKARLRLTNQINAHRFRQWIFHTQWYELKDYANARGIRLVGDIPIFVAHDSSDVWANRSLFSLDEKGYPTIVAGVPPDYFSATGQRWGNPLYRWEVMKENDYSWWISRFRAILGVVDLVRIDHFRGFEDYWEIPGSEPTAVKGRWVKGPNIAFFDKLREVLGELPIIAEDLGEITEEVLLLRDTLGLPGMKILQFAWDGPDNLFLPHNYTVNCVAYTGTHDNNTTLGWWNSGEGTDNEKRFMSEYLNREITDPVWTLLRLGMMSVAHTFIVPMQDVLGYGAETRMNMPGRETGNWGWRFTADKLQDPVKDRLAYLTKLYSRWPEAPEEEK
ncbi:MAG: 4-alpha-glucanotransferase [Chitinophagaceae bacterium]|nr:4-alpha-glucanotransferase [Anaerolineae bacterium]